MKYPKKFKDEEELKGDSVIDEVYKLKFGSKKRAREDAIDTLSEESYVFKRQKNPAAAEKVVDDEEEEKGKQKPMNEAVIQQLEKLYKLYQS